MKLTKKKYSFFFIIIPLFFIFIFSGTAICAEPQPGDVIDSSNIEQYKDYFPPYMQMIIKDGFGGILKPPAIHVKATEPIDQPDTYVEASKNNIGKVTLNSDGTLNGLVAGLPFPDPKEPNLGQKVLWNHFYRWRSDGYSYGDGYWYTEQKKGGRVTNALSQIDMLWFTNRTAVDPKPILPNRHGLYSALLLNSRTPPNKDMVTLAWRYVDQSKADDMWTYIPTLRRTLRLVSSERANPVRGTPFTWDDFYGFDGRIADWTPTLVGEPKMLMLTDQKTKCVKGTEFEHGYPHPVIHGPDDPYEVRGFYVLDIVPTAPRHPESKKTLYIENTIFHVGYAAVYDRQDVLWKGNNCTVTKYTTEQNKPAWTQCSESMTDFKNNFWSQNLLDRVFADMPMDPKRFDPAALGSNF